jgi:hypothetical protein
MIFERYFSSCPGGKRILIPEAGVYLENETGRRAGPISPSFESY